MRTTFACGLLLFLTGCFIDPRPVQDARELRTQAITHYAANSGAMVNFAIAAYQQAEYARVDALYYQDTDAAKQQANAAMAVAKVLELNAKRDQAKAKVDAQVAKLKAIADRAQRDPAIALKLDEAVREYENAGVDITAVPGTVDGILGILKSFGGK